MPFFSSLQLSPDRRRFDERVRAVARVVGAGVLLQSPDVAAEEYLQGTFAGTAGFTDNVRSSPDEPVPGVAPKTADAFLVLSPGLVLATRDNRASHRLTYELAGNVFFATFEASNISNRLEHQSFFDVSRDVDLLLSATAMQQHHHTSNRFDNVSATVLRSALPGTGRFLTARADEDLRLRLGRDWLLGQGAYTGIQTPLFVDAPLTWSFGGRLAFERLFRDDAVGPEARSEYSVMHDAVDADGTPVEDQQQLISSGVLRWRHDWGRYFTTSVEGGGTQVNRLTRERYYRTWIAAATFGYATRDATVELTVRRSASTNLFLAQTLVVNEAVLRGTLPLDRDGRVALGASVGYQRGQLLDVDAELATDVDVILGDVGIGWRAEDQLTLSLRYQYVDQRTDVNMPPLPLSFTRHSVMLGALLEFPRDEDMPREYRPPRRVDEGDRFDDATDVPGTPGAARGGS
jgi:hypothetical protein